MKLSHWFGTSFDDKPVNVGVYPTFFDMYYSEYPKFSYWNGVIWGCQRPTVEEAYNNPNYSILADQDKHWRGIIK